MCSSQPAGLRRLSHDYVLTARCCSEREEAVEAAAEQQVLAARHKAAQQETAAEAKQLRAEVRKLTQQLTNSRHSSR